MEPKLTKEQEIFSVADVNFIINSTLEQEIPRLNFTGEISEITFARSGHLYLTIKDETASLSAVMWKGSVFGLKFKPAVGLKIICEGKPNVYGATGRLQIILSQMTLAGEGDLQAKFKALYEKLNKEGLFDPTRKRSIPKFPLHVGIVTSQTGAVIHDIMVRIKERMPIINLYLYDCKVQGQGSAKEISEGIKFLNNFEPTKGVKLDVLIVGRGGGSLEDLWAFNEEEVVRAIFASLIPIISSVGHETDTCLSDFVADARAPTPTAAAEMVSMVRTELLEKILKIERRLKNYEKYILFFSQRIDEVEQRLIKASKNLFLKFHEILSKYILKVELLHPKNRIGSEFQKIDFFQKKLSMLFEQEVKHKKIKLDGLERTLKSLNPKSVLSRGFGILKLEGKIITSALKAEVGDRISVELKDGIILGEIYGKE